MATDIRYEAERAFYRVAGSTPSAEPGFVDVFPTEGGGDGRLRTNNRRTGAAQGKASTLRKAPCRQCGWPVDLAAVDHSGGDITANGAISGHTPLTATFTLSGAPGPNGKAFTQTEKASTPVQGVNAGCPLCGSKNSTALRTDVEAETDLSDRLTMPLGF